jgi:hypothetical protein
MYNYVDSRGVQRMTGPGTWEKVPFRQDYFPRVWSTDALMNKRDEFVATLLEHNAAQLGRMAKIMISYTISMVKRAEYTQVFGSDGERLTDMTDKAVLLEVDGDDLVAQAEKSLPARIKAWRKERSSRKTTRRCAASVRHCTRRR